MSLLIEIALIMAINVALNTNLFLHAYLTGESKDRKESRIRYLFPSSSLPPEEAV